MASTTLRRRLWKTPMRDLVRGRITGRLDIDKLLEEAGLPGPAANKVRNVVKRTRLWRLEKVDVAHELIAHFLDGREAGTPMDELLGSFGDETQTTKLIRRAKKRQRPGAWHAFAWARLGFGICIATYVLSALYLLTGSPSINTDYLALINKQASSVPKDEAAWPLYRQAMLEMNLWEKREWETPLPYYNDLPRDEQDAYWDEYEPPFYHSRMERLWSSLHPNDPGWAETEAFLKAHTDTLAMVREAASRPGLGLTVGFIEDYSGDDLRALNLHMSDFHMLFAIERSLVNMNRPHLWRLNQLAILLSADATGAAQRGDGELAYENILAMLAMARQADEQPTVQNGLVRIMIQTRAYRAIQQVLSEHLDLWSDQQLRNLAHLVSTAEIDPKRWVIGQRAIFYDVLQRIYTDNGHGGGRITIRGAKHISRYMPYEIEALIDQDVLASAGMPIATFMIAPRDEIQQMYDDLMDLAIVESQQPLWQTAEQSPLTDKFKLLQNDPTASIRYWPIIRFFESIPTREVQAEAGFRDGVLTGIALTLYRRQRGNWPGSLEDLTPAYLPSIPTDRLTGEPVRYRVKDGGPIVYSLGVDGDDDNGRVPPEDENGRGGNYNAGPENFGATNRHTHPALDGDWVLWPVPYED